MRNDDVDLERTWLCDSIRETSAEPIQSDRTLRDVVQTSWDREEAQREH